MRIKTSLKKNREAGSALIAATVTVSLLAGFSVSLLLVSSSVSDVQMGSLSETRALYAAQAAVSVATVTIREAEEAEEKVPGSVGSANAPLALGSGSAFANITAEADGSYTVQSFGQAGTSRRALEVTLVSSGEGAFSRALYAGNSSGDPKYKLVLAGNNAQADLVTGDVYSGGDIQVVAHASIVGDAAAAGKILGHATGEQGVTIAPPDLQGMQYESNHDFNVNDLFASASWKWDDAGGSAWQVPEDNPAHIFRKNPNDRNSTNNATAKDDYYLEDPYEPVRKDSTSKGTDPFPISVTGVNGKPGVSGTDAVYFIDGNLWIHNHPTYSFQFVSGAAEHVRVTFVVKGNITFSDNIYYEDSTNDGIVFIALDDPDVADSGNIYFGDPVGGTIEYMDSFMYAENDFIDTNMSATGSKQVEVHGTMAAGNQVAIERDFGNNHSKLTVTADTRLADGLLTLPRVPANLSGANVFSVSTWREISYDAAP